MWGTLLVELPSRAGKTSIQWEQYGDIASPAIEDLRVLSFSASSLCVEAYRNSAMPTESMGHLDGKQVV